MFCKKNNDGSKSSAKVALKVLSPMQRNLQGSLMLKLFSKPSAFEGVVSSSTMKYVMKLSLIPKAFLRWSSLAQLSTVPLTIYRGGLSSFLIITLSSDSFTTSKTCPNVTSKNTPMIWM